MGLWSQIAKAGTKIATKIGWKGGFFLGAGGILGSAAANANYSGGDSGGILPGWIFDPLGLGDLGRMITIGIIAVVAFYAFMAYKSRTGGRR
jgi:hypothetical protein